MDEDDDCLPRGEENDTNNRNKEINERSDMTKKNINVYIRIWEQ